MNKTGFTKTAVAVLALCGLSCAAQADTIFGLYVSAGQWIQDFSGQFQSSGDNATALDMQDDFGFGKERGNVWSIAVEHPLPLIPNVRLSHAELKQSGQYQGNIDVTYGGNTYEGTATIDSDLDLSFDDYLLYYEILDNWVSLDIGINARRFDGSIAMQGTLNGTTTSGSSSEELKGWIPMLYGRADFQLPLTGLSLGGEFTGLSVGDASIKDYKVRVAYETSIGLGIEVGQRAMTIDYDTGDSGDVVVDLEFKGSYAAATFHF